MELMVSQKVVLLVILDITGVMKTVIFRMIVLQLVAMEELVMNPGLAMTGQYVLKDIKQEHAQMLIIVEQHMISQQKNKVVHVKKAGNVLYGIHVSQIISKQEPATIPIIAGQ